MPPPAPTRKTDDFDMAKLQKSLKQRQRHSHSMQNRNVAKLTPAEIRSLNNSAAASKISSQQSSGRSSLNSNRRMSNATPPATPDHHAQSAYQAQVSRSSSFDLPTPPHSPNLQHRRASHSSVQNGHRHHTHIHAPKPRSTAKADFMSANGLNSRPSSSSTTSSFHGLPMYRGHEVTRTGSKNMLQRPAQEIVTNPLSMYSRPRQSLVQSSPQKHKSDFQEIDAYQAQAMLNMQDEHNVPSLSSRAPSPPMVTDSPVSIGEKPGETEKFPIMEPEKPQANAKPQNIPQSETREPQMEKVDLDSIPIELPTETGSHDVAEEPKKPKKRFTFHQAFFDKKEKDSSAAVLKKKKGRRRTVSFTKNLYDDDEFDNYLEEDEYTEYDGLVNGHSSDTEGHGEFPPNPAVRPLSSDGSYASSVNGAKRSMSSDDINRSIQHGSRASTHSLAPISIPSRPVYGRCACCGKLKRPSGYASELSPVLENENIRANFSFEIERGKTTVSNRSSAEKKRYTAIIPMEIREGDSETGSIRTVQASIAPYEPSITSMRGAVGKPERKKRMSDPGAEGRVVRFASLHARKAEGDDGGVEDEEEDEEDVIEESSPVVEQDGRMVRLSMQAERPQEVLQEEEEEFIAAMPDPNPNRKSMPKQDVINVVGWEHGRRVDQDGKAIENNLANGKGELKGRAITPESPIKEKEEKKKSRVSGILKVLQPRPKSTVNPDIESPVKPNNTRSIADDATNLPVSTTLASPNQENVPADEQGSKFAQYDAKETSKSKHAPKLSLHLGKEDGGLLGLPTPHLGPHFARSSATLRDLVLANGAATPEMHEANGIEGAKIGAVKAA